jgi:hypothetical protein
VPKISGALTGCAGEHFIAYRLSAMGYHVALTRGGVPFVDVLVGTADGRNAVAVQVKTKNEAFSPATKKDPTSCWYWQIKPNEFRGKSAFYAFVDLKGGTGEVQSPMPMPDVFIVPADIVAAKINEALEGSTKNERTKCWVSAYGKPPKMFFFEIEAGQDRSEKNWKGQWSEAWYLIDKALGTNKSGDV